MTIIKVSDSSRRYGDQLVDEAAKTPRELFNDLGVNYQRGTTSLNGTILSGDDLDKSFASLGIVGGTAVLNSVVKADGGCF